MNYIEEQIKSLQELLGCKNCKQCKGAELEAFLITSLNGMVEEMEGKIRKEIDKENDQTAYNRSALRVAHLSEIFGLIHQMKFNPEGR